MSDWMSPPSEMADAAAQSNVQQPEVRKLNDYDFERLYPRRRTFKPTSMADAVMEYLRLQGIYTATDFERTVRDLQADDKIWRKLDPDDDDLRMRCIAKALSENPWLKYVRHWHRQVADNRIWTLIDFDQIDQLHERACFDAA